MGDEQHRRAVIALQVADQGQDLLLRGDVERGGGLVGDQELRLQHQRHRDHDALPLAAGKVVRIEAKMRSTSGRRTCSIMSRMRFVARRGVEIGVGAQHLVDLAADRHDRIERGHRLLENHRHLRRAQLPQAAVGRGEQLLADELDAAAGRHQRALRQQAHRVSEVTDLPEPLSPTRQSVSPWCTWIEMPSMTCALRLLPMETTRLLMSRTGLVIT